MACKKQIKIIQGEARVIPLGIVEDNGSPLDLTNATEIKVWFKNADNTFLECKMTGDDPAVTILGDALRGEINVELTAVQTALFKTCNQADFQGEVTITTPKRILWEEQLTVIKSESA